MKDKTQYTLDISWLLWQFAYFEFELHLSSFEFWWDTELQTKRKTFFNWNWGIFVFFIIINRRRYLSYTHVHLPSNRVVGTWGCLGGRRGDITSSPRGGGQIMPTTFLLPLPRIFRPSYGPVSNHAQGNGFTGLFLPLPIYRSVSFICPSLQNVRFYPVCIYFVLYFICTIF